MLLLYDYRIVDNILLLLLLIQGQGHILRNKCDIYVKVFCEVFLLFIFLTVSTHFFIHISSVIKQFFFFQNNPKNLGGSRFLGLLGRVKLVLYQDFIVLI